ncbi:hypothetical protein [Leekyejoonella antrihumi]|uniref:DUF4913 domain-containing protein n=1 Tax=Leekyejoonella antrihumi TaxID=1660198 RepID=A0A563DSI5_9MICO|nr:hypothetical protein [Leekyejoonella antrihumi]TWP33139.1 hypothetical protein FGL98_22345 [Leekyejoonella antrihumi]
MTTTPGPVTTTIPAMVAPFPTVGPHLRLAYRELNIAENGTAEQIDALGIPVHRLPRPWDPATCLDPELRAEVWEWLDRVVAWLNRDYTWDVAAMIPACWPEHPHLIHEIAAVADQRRRAGNALSSNPLEEWHRYCLPAFVDRMRGRCKDHCEDEHTGWPGRSRHNYYLSDEAATRRRRRYADDLEAAQTGWRREQEVSDRSRLALVDLDSGDIIDE